MDISNIEHWHFEMTEGAANFLLKLVLEGKKRATSSSFLGYKIENSPIPEIGQRSVITYWDGTPGCVIETVNVRIIPYRDITFELAKLEGEDETLESWQKNHSRFFTEEGKEIGYTFTEDMPVVFEEFEIISLETNSGVSETPIGDEEGIRGCLNRIKDANNQEKAGDLYEIFFKRI